jgi:anti-sigma factor RsiW
LDYIDGRPVAALVYQRREHKINVYIWPSQNAGTKAVQETESQGYNELHWGRDGMAWWVISDLNKTELLEFAHLLQQP